MLLSILSMSIHKDCHVKSQQFLVNTSIDSHIECMSRKLSLVRLPIGSAFGNTYIWTQHQAGLTQRRTSYLLALHFPQVKASVVAAC